MSLFSQKRLAERQAELQRQQADAADRLTVMIVDDENGNLAVMRSILSPHYEVLEAGDGQQALDLIHCLSPAAGSRLACIVSDHRMPCLTGVELFEQAQQLLPHTCRIIVTGFVDIDTIIASINLAKIYQFIVKPFDASDFMLTVRRAVEAFELQRQVAAYQDELEQKVEQRTRELLAANRELQASAEQILELYNNASCGYHSIGADGVFVHVNDTELEWLGRSREELVGKIRFSDLLTPASLAALLARCPQIAADGWLTGLSEVEVEFLRPDGRVVPVLLNATTVTQTGQALARYTVFDITRRKRSEARIRHLASHDQLTGLPNRALLRERMTQALADAARQHDRLALVFVDLDHFKDINDSLGHHIGDGLLVEVAERLRNCVRHSDTVARLGGDEFVLLLPALAADFHLHNLVKKVVGSLAEPFQIAEHTLRIGASAGISIYPDHSADIDQLMQQADAAMYQAKNAGRNSYRVHGDVSK